MLPSSTSYMHHHHDIHTPTWRLGLPPVDRVGTVQTPHPSSHTSSCPIPIRVPERFTNRLQTMGGSWLHDGAGDSQVSAHLQVAKRFWERRELIFPQVPVREDEQGEACVLLALECLVAHRGRATPGAATPARRSAHLVQALSVVPTQICFSS